MDDVDNIVKLRFKNKKKILVEKVDSSNSMR